MQKVKLPRKVAEAMDQIKSIHKYPIRAVIEKFNGEKIDDYPALGDYFEQDRSRRIETIMEALVNGYEIEETIEEKVRSYYETLIRERDRTDIRKGVCHAATLTARIDTLMEVLHMQGITYQGVNDHGES